MRDAEGHEKLDFELCNAKLQLGIMENWKKSVTYTDQKTAAALLKVAEVKGAFSKVARNLNEFETRLSGVWAESGRRLVHLNTMFLVKARVDKLLRGVIKQSVSVFGGIATRLGDDIVCMFRAVLEKA